MLQLRSSLFTAVLLFGAGPATAEIAVSANDGKVRMVDGVVQVQKDGKDTITLIDLAASPPKPIGELDVPASVVGPPLSVAVAPNETIALVAAAAKIDPADPTKTVPDDRVTVVDLGGDPSILSRVKAATGIAKAEGRKPPSVIANVQAGAGAAGLSINAAGTLALVANRNAGTITVLKIEGKIVTNVGTVDLGNPTSGPSHVAFTPDGKQAYVTRDGDHKISVLTVEGIKVEYTKRDLTAGIRPYGLDIARNGLHAVVANIGTSSGDADTMSLIDLKANPSRVVTTVTVGQTPEGIKLSPDGKFVAVNLMGGTNIPAGKPGSGTKGSVQIWSVGGREMKKVAETPTGGWCQGLAWSRNGRILLVQCMIEQEILMFRLTGVTGRSFDRIGVIKTTGGPAAIRTAER
jgi:DNA-binding beta-propeller fold protein YncE